ncbi:L-fucose:H+ symporter permease [Periweissella fabaria]|uniref:L-fucose-proton symporter n=1 Tax=Periweissella fabaria TaxID=546157 RepID=A0ABN8BMP9_9LACO|nr:L-fucose:H+ symporter permease [Periweissella fabaria]MCM0596962.1 L-fucose:H+ symporter permease [Periweissella fabaria]CAH0416917.1 L-fucose-proton symporter [Periweissella fabaria]
MINAVGTKTKHRHDFGVLADGYLTKTPILQFIIVSMMFPLWGTAASLNDILITQFKTVFELNDAATAFVQSAFYGGYFLVAIPASIVIKKTTYKTAILTGLVAYILGAGLFFPASRVATYSMFLVAIFAIAIGLSFLETACDTYSSLLGPKEHANLRLNISQILNPIGSITGILLGKYLIFGQVGNLSEKMASLHGAARIAYGEKMLQLTLQPYKYILFVLVAMLIILALTPMPNTKPAVAAGQVKAKLGETLSYLAHNRLFKKGIMAQFVYVGMQTAVWSFTIRLVLDLNHSISDAQASMYMVYSYIVFFLGKVVATSLFTRIKPTKVLATYSILGTIALVVASLAPGNIAIYATVAASFFFGPQWPTIYAHTLDTVTEKKHTETAGAVLVMAIVGGAVIPAIQGIISDAVGSMQLSFLFPALCFAIVSIYFMSEVKNDIE